MVTPLYYNLGFKENPFSKKSSEQETKFLKEIFYEPNYYNTLTSSLGSGDTKFIIGQRGHGKTCIINNIYKDLESFPEYLVVLIDRYEAIPEKNNEAHFVILIIQAIVKRLCFELYKDKSPLRHIDQIDKEKLYIIIRGFFTTMSKSEFEKACDRVTCYKRKNFFKRLFNTYIFHTANHIASTVVNISSDTICRSIGLTGMEQISNYREYFPALELTQVVSQPVLPNEINLTQLKDTLYSICELYNKLGKKNIIVLFDKIDEFNLLGQDITKIAIFIKDFLSDTELLLNPNIAIGFSLWSELKAELKSSVRFDKFGSSDIRWENSNMEPLLNKRLSYFSKSERKIKFTDLISSELDRDDIIDLSNKSPRDLISLMDFIYQEQDNINPQVESFNDKSIRAGMIKFCKDYHYDSQIPSNTGKNKDVTAMVNRLLRQKLLQFTHKDLSKTLGQSDNQSEGQIKLMIKYRLVREDELSMQNGLSVYEVIDPKVKFLIKHLVERID